MNLLITVVAFLFTLGVLVVVHEFGHYWAARRCGVKVLRFSVGFGRILASRRIGPDQTEWAIAAFPLGGYVKMLDEREGDVAPGELQRAFNRQPVWRRFLIVLAGPVANFLLAILLYWLLFLYGVPGIKPTIGTVTPGSPAAAAQFTPGETITRVGPERVISWEDARWALLEYASRRAVVPLETRTAQGDIVLRRLDLSQFDVANLDAGFLDKIGFSRLQPLLPPVVDKMVAGSPAERAGLRMGDEIIAIGDQKVEDIGQAIRIIRENPGKPLLFRVRRGGNTVIEISVIPDARAGDDGKLAGHIDAMLRASEEALANYVVTVRYGPVEGMLKAAGKTWDTSVFSLRMLGKMLIGEMSFKNLSGPITIADYAGQSAQIGWIPYLMFMALVSISLGVLNLLPIPLLDGGHLMYYIFEISRGKPVSDKVMAIGQNIGMALLFILMAFALYNDITHLISHS
ncbi:MAG TPA: RIP metalloprotease RseP [Burkholderiales bacterium]|nr:RIP metalloprotease RseP [Burkholderiales bacterium]